MNPELAVAVGRNLEARHGHALTPGVIGSDEQRAGAGHHPQHFQGQRRHDRALRLHDHRHAAHDAVAFDADGEQAAPAAGLLKDRHVAQQAGVIQKIGPRIVAHGRNPHRTALAHRSARPRKAARTRQAPRANCRSASAKTASLLGSARSFSSRSIVEIAESIGGDAGRHPVGLGEYDVERDDERAHLRQAGDQIGNARARPWPLADRLQALFIDIDDDDRPFRRIARMEHLEKIEDANAQLLERQRIGDAQAGKRDQADRAQAARASPNRRAIARKPCHLIIAHQHAIRRTRHFSRNARMN